MDFMFVLHGYGGENSLLPLAAYLQKIGCDVLVVDNQVYPLSRGETIAKMMDGIKGKRVIYITSGHLWCDSRNYEEFHTEYPSMIAPVEMIRHLHPVCSVYYPHDLSCFMHENERRWISLFDLVLLPYRSNDYYYLKHVCKHVEVVGWIKKDRKLPAGKADCTSGYSPVFFPSNINSFYRQLGVEGYADWFIRYIHPSIPLKMPGIRKELYDILVKKGFTILDSSVSVYDTFEVHNLVIGSGESSIIYEAALSGMPVISILDGVVPDWECLEHVGRLKGVYALHPEEVSGFIEDLNKNHIVLDAGPDILGVFDFGKVFSLIIGAAEHT